MRLAWLSADGKKLLVARTLRTFAYGYLAVVLALYLAGLGYDPVAIGVVLAAAIAGSAAMTIVWTLLADRVGRRRTMVAMALLMVAGGLLFAHGGAYWILLLGAFTGTISATSSEVGAFLTVEQAILPQTAPAERRTWLFSIYATVANFAQAAGSLFAAGAGALASLVLAGADVHRPLFVLYALVGLASALLFASLSERVEVARVEGARRLFGIHRSRGAVAKLAALFGIDAFAGGLIAYSVVAYWFALRWGLTLEELGVLFFAVNLLSGLSLLAAGALASRIGLVNTMVFTHLPSNLLLMAVPLMPTAGLAVALFLARMSISQMDVPTRQSYAMAIVDPDERVGTAGLTNVARTAASAAAPALSGYAFSVAALGLPFFVAGGVKIIYDLLVYAAFSRLRPPEEAR
ncbi:MAG: MFS transporter [Candidatus Limnocylindria bacterium]